jgi:hypothetical protein
MTHRDTVLCEVGKHILTSCSKEHITRVSIEGAGKSFFANELTEVLRNQGKTVHPKGMQRFMVINELSRYFKLC